MSARLHLLLLVLVLLVGSARVASAQRLAAGIDPEDAAAPGGDVQAKGIKVGEGTVLHPVLGLETGYISNVFYEENGGTGAGIIRLLAEMDTSSLPASRLAENDVSASPGDIKGQRDIGLFEYDASVHASYDRYLSDNGHVSDQGGLGLGALFRGVVNPEKPVVFGVFDTYSRLIRATNFESSTDTNRDVNLLKLHLLWQPYGRTISAMLHYTNIIDVFEHEEQRFADRIQNSLGVRVNWQALPRTRVSGDVTESINTGLGDASTKVTSYPFTVSASVQTAITVNSTVVARIGYTNGFYATGPSYSTVVAGAQVGYRFSPYARVTATYSYDHEDSINANYYRDHAFSVHYEHRLPPFVAIAAPEIRLREYDGIMSGGIPINGPDTRNDLIISIPVELRYSFRDWFAISAEYAFSTIQTDYKYMVDGVQIDPGYVRHELLLGVRAAF